MTCYKYSITCQDDLLTVDNVQSHVTAFRPISEATRSWSDDNCVCVFVCGTAFWSQLTSTVMWRHLINVSICGGQKAVKGVCGVVSALFFWGGGHCRWNDKPLNLQ